MLRFLAILFVLCLPCITAQAAGAADCRFCLDSVAIQTRDGQAWTAGQPVTLVVHVADTIQDGLPSAAQVVVMQTDGDRTKCLGVPLKLVQSDASGGLYAGLFFPFHPARYDGVLVIGGDVESITFDVNQVVAGAAPAGDLPAAEPIDTSAPPLIRLSDWRVQVLAAVLVAISAVLVLAVSTRPRHSTQTVVS